MSYIELLQQIFQVCIIPLLGVLTAYAVALIKKKTEELKVKTDNELYSKYMDMLRDTVVDCVVATNQTYVDALKDKNAFDADAQREAFKRTSEAVLNILSVDAKDYLTAIVGDLSVLIDKMIEAQVKYNKITE